MTGKKTSGKIKKYVCFDVYCLDTNSSRDAMLGSHTIDRNELQDVSVKSVVQYITSHPNIFFSEIKLKQCNSYSISNIGVCRGYFNVPHCIEIRTYSPNNTLYYFIGNLHEL